MQFTLLTFPSCLFSYCNDFPFCFLIFSAFLPITLEMTVSWFMPVYITAQASILLHMAWENFGSFLLTYLLPRLEGSNKRMWYGTYCIELSLESHMWSWTRTKPRRCNSLTFCHTSKKCASTSWWHLVYFLWALSDKHIPVLGCIWPGREFTFKRAQLLKKTPHS